MRNIVLNKILCDKMSKPSDSEVISVGLADELSVSITFDNAANVKMNFLASTDGVNYHAIEGTAMDAGDTFLTSVTRAQLYSFDISMATYFKVQVETIDSGSICMYATSFSIS